MPLPELGFAGTECASWLRFGKGIKGDTYHLSASTEGGRVWRASLERDPAVLFVDGPRWKTAAPPATRDFSAIGNYCILWSPEDLPQLSAEFIPAHND